MDAPTPYPLPQETAPEPGVRRAGLFELTGYTGLALAVAGVVEALVSRAPSLGSIAGVEVVVTCVLLIGGFFVGRAEHDAFLRMRSVMWFGAVISWTSATVILFGPPGADLSGKTFPLVVTIAIALMALPLWWMDRRSLQAIAGIVSVTSVLLVLGYAEHTRTFTDPIFGSTTTTVPSLTADGLIAVMIGAALLRMGARRMVTPQKTTMVLGAILFVNGAGFIGYRSDGGESTVGLILALLATAALLFIGERTNVLAIRGLGIVALLSNATSLVGVHIHTQDGAWVVAFAGLGLLSVTVVLALRAFPAPRTGPTPPPPVPPMPAEAGPMSAGEPQG